MRKRLFAVIFILFFSGMVYASTQQETLDQYVSDLNKNPEDNALREKIIKLALVMNPAPKAPDEVDGLVGKAAYAVKHAKSEADFFDAIDAYQKVLLIAPWVPEYYYNLGAVQEKAGKLKEAVGSLEFYLMAAPSAKDGKEVREHIGGLKYAAEKAMKVNSPSTIAGQEQDSSEDWLKMLDGRRYSCPVFRGKPVTQVIDVRGNVFVLGVIADGHYSEGSESSRIEIQGKETKAVMVDHFFNTRSENRYVISEDGSKITQHAASSNGETADYIYLWQK